MQYQQLENEIGYQTELNEYFDAIPDTAILSPQQVAQILNRSTETIRRWCREGKLEAYNESGHYAILGNDFKKFLLNSKTKPKKRLLI
jgi:excisionase family DNA binding protein